MRGGRFFCVALPLILCIAAIISLLYAALAGVSHRRLNMFSVDVSNLTIDASDARDFISNLDVSNLADSLGDNIEDTIKENLPEGSDLEDLKSKLPDGTTLDDLKDKLPDGTSLDNIDIDNIDIDSLLGNNNKARRALEARQDTVITASTLGLGDKYQVTLWGYCRVDSNGDRNCTDPEWDWASKHFNTSVLDTLAEQTGLNITLPKELHDALDVFKPVTKWTQIGFVISIVALAVEFVIGIFANWYVVFNHSIHCNVVANNSQHSRYLMSRMALGWYHHRHRNCNSRTCYSHCLSGRRCYRIRWPQV
jgi:hypothetical protein